MLSRIFYAVIFACILNNSITQAESAVTSGLYFGNETSAKMTKNNLHRNVQILTKSPSTSLESCISECKQRDECGYIYFVRRWAMCYVLKISDGNTEPEDQLEYAMAKRAGPVFGVKVEWRDENGSQQSTTDSLPTVCGPQPEIPNTVRTGNMNHAGSKVMYQCQQGYASIGEKDVFTTCGQGGDWEPASIECIDQGCPQGWRRYMQKCYKLGEKAVHQSKAKDYCEGFTEGRLVQVDTRPELDWLKELMFTASPQPTTGYWNGLEEEGDNVERWQPSGADLDPEVADWKPGQPYDNHGTQTCTAFWKDYDYKMADIECKNDFRQESNNRKCFALCEKPVGI